MGLRSGKRKAAQIARRDQIKRSNAQCRHIISEAQKAKDLYKNYFRSVPISCLVENNKAQKTNPGKNRHEKHITPNITGGNEKYHPQDHNEEIVVMEYKGNELVSEYRNGRQVLVWAINMLNVTVKHMYQSSIGWNQKEKISELTDNSNRLWLLKRGEENVGFVSFRFDEERWDTDDENNDDDEEEEEEEEDSDDNNGDPEGPIRAVIYLYEIHLLKELRGRGIGSQLLQVIEKLGKDLGFDGVMLTVFPQLNPKAYRLYVDKLGYVIDKTSPSMYGIDADYEILFKRLSTRKYIEEGAKLGSIAIDILDEI